MLAVASGIRIPAWKGRERDRDRARGIDRESMRKRHSQSKRA